jgi:beta-phosphoglucomutase-like phosphatase (HAD superfamily)
LIFEFDGPVCDLSAVMPADTADRLRALLVSETGTLPPEIVATSEPAEILAFAAGVSQEAAVRVDAELTSIEATAVATATPGAYIHEALAACRDSGRTAAIVSRHSADAVRAYLDQHSLGDQIRHFTAVSGYPPGHLQTRSHLTEETVRALGSKSADCALITASAAGIDAARKTGTHTIGYPTTPSTSQNLTAAGATCIVQSLADLTLRLRARPLPT